MPNTTHAGIGHNLPPIEAMKSRVDELVDTGNRWITERETIETEDHAGKANDFLTQLRAEYKAVEKERKAEKQPHIDAGKAVDEEYKPLTALLDATAKRIKAMLTPYLTAKQRREDEERREREEQARKAQEEADRKAAEAAKSDDPIRAQIAADEAAERAEEVDKAAAAVPEHATVKGEFGRAASLRTTYRGEIVEFDKCLDHFRDHPKIKDALETLVNAAIRGGNHDIPGVNVRQEQTAA